MADAPGEDTGDGLAAAVGSVEDLGEEDPEGDGRAEEAVAEADLFGLEDLLDLIGR